MVFCQLAELGIGRRLAENLNAITDLSQNNGLKEVMGVVRKLKAGTAGVGRVPGNLNILKNLQHLEWRRKQQGFRKIKELYLFLLWKLTDKCMNRWCHTNREIKFQNKLGKTKNLAYASFNFKDMFARLSCERLRFFFLAIKLRSERNTQLSDQRMAIRKLSSLFDKANKVDLIHGFAVIKVLFEFKSELDDRIKLNSKMTNLRSTINNNLLQKQRVRRRFIRNPGEVFWVQDYGNENPAAENAPVGLLAP